MSDTTAIRAAAQIQDDPVSVAGERVDREQDLYDGIEYQVRSYVSRALMEEGAVDCVDQIHAYADQMIEHLNATQVPPIKVACKAGCSWCCHLDVEVTLPEVSRIVAFLRQSLDADSLERVIANVRETHRQKMAREVSGDVPKTPCALLVEGLCSVYAVRPLKCRGGNSTDAETCKMYFETGENGLLAISAPQLLAADSIQNGLARGSSPSVDRSDRLELVAALAEAFESPENSENMVNLDAAVYERREERA